MLLDTLTPAALVSRGFIPGIPNEQYHAAPGTSKSGIDEFLRSPAHFLAYLSEERKETSALRFGRIFHRFILEPDVCKLAVAPKVDLRTTKGKETWAEFQEKHQECDIVSAEDMRALEGMRTSVYAHPAARDLLDIPGETEISRWNFEPNTYELCKVRPDKRLVIGRGFDLKSCEDASRDGFAKACAKYLYHVQAAFYPDIAELDKDFPFIAVEKEAPFAVAVYRLDRADVELGRYLYQTALERIAQCKVNNFWPGYSEKIETLTLPAWAKKGAIGNE